MLAVLSPAKSLDESPPPLDVPVTQPVLMKDAQSLMRTSRGLSQKKLQELMSISPDLAKLNYHRFRSFDLPMTKDNALPSSMMFAGDVYRGLDARSLGRDDLEWAQDRVAILSGLYGILRPLDLVQPYRLEMGTRLKTRRGASLYQFWGDKIAERVDALVAGHEDPTLVNLASNEYFKSISKKKLKAPVVACRFEDWRDSAREPRVVSFLAKYARGAMARFVIEHRVDRVEGLKDFATDGYAFVPDRSSDDELVFGRVFTPAT